MAEAKIKVLYVTPDANLYGSDISLLELVRRLDKSSFEPSVVLPYPGPLFNELKKIPGVSVKVLNLAVLRRKYYNPLGILVFSVKCIISTTQLWHLIKKYSIDLVHSNSSRLPVGALAAKIARVPHIWHIREITIKPAVLNFLLSKAITHFSRATICISQAVKDSITKYSSWNSQSLVMRDQVCFSRLSDHNGKKNIRDEFQIKPYEKIVGMVSRINFRKGQNNFLQVAAMIKQQLPDTKFFVVGSADPQYGHNVVFQKLKRQQQVLGLSKDLFFTGFRPDIGNVISAFDVFVHPSVEPEGLGRVILEAMACGVPVVATASGGPLEIIMNGQTGYLVPPGDLNTMSQTIMRLLRDRQMRKLIGSNAREAISEFDIDRSDYIQRMENLYWSLTRKEKKKDGKW